MSREKTAAIRAAREAGKFLLGEFKKAPSAKKMKARHEIVTAADLKSEKIILSILKKEFPQHDFLSEEDGLTKNGGDCEHLWIVDPIDGTTNFFMRNPIFCVSIALARKGEIILGVIYSPVTRELYVAEKGKGAYLNGKRIRASKREKIKESILTFCHGSGAGYIRKSMDLFRDLRLKSLTLRQLGAAAIELGFVAAGRVESIMIPGARSWDVAAGILLVREAGGKVTDFEGEEWTLKSKDMLATNGKVHAELLRNIKKVLKK